MYIVTGSNGLLARTLRQRVGGDTDYVWAARQHFDITNTSTTERFIRQYQDSLTVHLAAYTATSRADSDRKKCYLTNVVGTRNVAESSDRILYVSTDHVFDGSKGDYSEADEPCPWNHYGWTKLMGEKEAQKTKTCKVIRCTFRPKPFPYPVAWRDSLTTALWVEDMAEALHWCIENYAALPPIIHIGGKKQDYYSFASEIGPITAGPAPLQFPKDLSLDSSKYRLLRGS